MGPVDVVGEGRFAYERQPVVGKRLAIGTDDLQLDQGIAVGVAQIELDLGTVFTDVGFEHPARPLGARHEHTAVATRRQAPGPPGCATQLERIGDRHAAFELPVRIERPEHEVAGNGFAAVRDAAHDERRHRRQIEQELGRVAEDQGDLLRRRRAGALQAAGIADADPQQALAGEQGRLGLVPCEAEAAEREPRDLRDRHGTLGEHVRAAAHASHEPSAPWEWGGQHDGRACVPIASDRLACRLQHAALRIDGSRRDKPGSIGGQLDRLDADPFAARPHLGAAERARCQAPIALHLHVLGAIPTGNEGERKGDLRAPVAEEHDHGRSQEHVERIDCVMRS
ncbi:MAG: hypothetical protein R3F05_01505 [Planctomycetota bacterium]